jgi:hypothetical protein
MHFSSVCTECFSVCYRSLNSNKLELRGNRAFKKERLFWDGFDHRRIFIFITGVVPEILGG